MAFLRAAARGFRAYTWAARAHSGSPPQASLGSWDSPLRCLLTHPGGVTSPTPEGSRDPTLRGHLTHPCGVT